MVPAQTGGKILACGTAAYVFCHGHDFGKIPPGRTVKLDEQRGTHLESELFTLVEKFDAFRPHQFKCRGVKTVSHNFVNRLAGGGDRGKGDNGG